MLTGLTCGVETKLARTPHLEEAQSNTVAYTLRLMSNTDRDSLVTIVCSSQYTCTSDIRN